MTRATRLSRFLGAVVALCLAVAMVQERSVAGQETGSPASPPAATKSTAAAVLTYQLQFSTYFGGAGGDLLRDMTVDAQGNIYVAGVAGPPDFPRTPGVIPGQSDAGGAMVAKFSPAGTLVWSKVVAGEYFYSVKVDRTGHVFVAGRMRPGFPTTPGPAASSASSSPTPRAGYGPVMSARVMRSAT
jgi:hypothetical protein